SAMVTTSLWRMFCSCRRCSMPGASSATFPPCRPSIALSMPVRSWMPSFRPSPDGSLTRKPERGGRPVLCFLFTFNACIDTVSGPCRCNSRSFMKKSAVLAGSLVVAAAAYTGAAWYVGMEAENTIRAAVDRANQRIIKTLGPDVGSVGATLSIDAYQRGLFSSRARYTFTLQDGDDRTQVTFEDHMQHGPFPWGLVSQGVWAPQLAWSRSQLVDTESVKRWFDAARGAMPVLADTRIGFGGRGKSAWRFAPLEWVSDDEQLSFSGGQGDVEFSSDFRDSDAQGGFEQLTLGEGAGDTVVLRKIDLKSTTRTAADDSVKVDSQVNIGAMVMDAG